ncbi:MAG TPA: MBG domain-containing protein, partial [Geobacteraceae bacterium]
IPAPVTVTANGLSKTYGAADPTLSYTVTGLVNNDTVNVFTGSLTRVAGESVGSYAISQGTLSAGTNYTIAFSPANLTIGKASQIITFGSLAAKTVLSAPFTVSATASSNLSVGLSIVSGPATISGNTITLTGAAGAGVVRASQAGDGNFNPAADVDQSFQVAIAEGDANMNGTVELADAQWTLQAAAGVRTLDVNQKAHADVFPLSSGVPNPDGVVDIRDALLTLRKVVGLVTSF